MKIYNDIFDLYKLEDKTRLDEINSDASLFRHIKSGAGIVCLENNDEKKVFSVTFKTPPFDDTGVFHILEHSVLAGSEKYPVKEPFNELIKGSLYTYLNALTFSDKTMYPVGSCNDADFYNLMSVYLDAVFFPKIYKKKESFMQEAWNYYIKDKESPIVYNGIVYNEMKGAYSDPMRMLGQMTNRTLFPDNCYRFDSGGNPDFIPNLKYEDFLDTHRKYYHPSNCFIFFYGDMDVRRCFEFLNDEYLSRFESRDPAVYISKQRELGGELHCSSEYDSPSGDKNLMLASFLTSDFTDAEHYYAFKILSNILLSASGSPIKKALLENNIGEEVLGGFDSDMRQMVFGVVVKNSVKTLDEFRKVLMNTLEETVRVGIDPKLAEACINKAEFHYREEDYGHMPKGLIYNMICLSSWLYGGGPFGKLRRLEILGRIRGKAQNTRYFENLIDKYLLNGSRFVFSELVARKEKDIDNKESELSRNYFSQERLRDFKDSLTDMELERLIEQTLNLEAYQNEDDSPEDLAKIPFVKLSDINEHPSVIETEHDVCHGFNILHTHLETNEIIYANFMFDTKKLPPNLLYAAGLISYLLGKMSTKKHNYGDLDNDITNFLGGFSVEFARNKSAVVHGAFAPKLVIKVKCLSSNAERMFEIVSEVINDTVFDGVKRLSQLISELKSGMSRTILVMGDTVAAYRAESYLTQSGKYTDEVLGLGFYDKIHGLDINSPETIEMLLCDLNRVRDLVFNKQNFILNLTCADEFETCAALGRKFYDSLDMQDFPNAETLSLSSIKNEALSTSSLVQYNAMAGDFRSHGYEYGGHLKVLAKMINSGYFMSEIRLKGGAYGFQASITEDGSFRFTSYRDPNIKNTYRVFRSTGEYVKNISLSTDELTKYILGVINALDKPLLPRNKGELALNNYLCGRTRKMIEAERSEVLAAKASDLRNCAGMLEECIKNAVICTVGSRSAIESAKDIFSSIRRLDV